MSIIHFYRTNSTYGCFSNFSRHGFLLDGIYWPTAEHYFQSEKFLETNLKVEIANLASPLEAAIYGRNKEKPLRPDWEYIKIEIMRCTIYNKFNQNPDINEILISTENYTLVEHTKNDSYWGDGGNGTGENMLGKLLMELRDNTINNEKCS